MSSVIAGMLLLPALQSLTLGWEEVAQIGNAKKTGIIVVSSSVVFHAATDYPTLENIVEC